MRIDGLQNPVNLLKGRTMTRRNRLVTKLGMRSTLIACICATASLAFAVSASAAGSASLGVGTNTAGSQTSVQVAVDGGGNPIDGFTVTLPTSLNGNWSALGNRCSASVLEADPAACPAASVFGTAEVTTPLVGTPLTGSVIAYDAGGSLPGIALATDDGGSVTSLILMSVAHPPTIAGYMVQLNTDSGIEGPPVTAVDIDFSGGSSGQAFKVQTAAYCYPSDAADASIWRGNGREYVISSAISFSGCSNGGWITSGPAVGDTIETDSVTFNYRYTGAGSFSKFRCALVSLDNESNSPTGSLTDCGTVKTGSSKTYSNLPNGLYAFRVYKYPSGGGYDVRRFRVNKLDSTTTLVVNNAVANGNTMVELTAGLDSANEGSITSITLRMPASVGFNNLTLDEDGVCSNEAAFGSDPLGDCSPNSIYGDVQLTMPLLNTTVTGSLVVFDAGGTMPGLLLIAQDSGLGVDFRTPLYIGERATAAGTFLEFSSSDSLAYIDPAVTDIVIAALSNVSSEHLFKVKPANYCYPSDAADSTITSTNGGTVDSVSNSQSFSGCSNGGLITSGPAMGSTGNPSTVTFNYRYTGSGSFSKFRCGLVKLSGPSNGSTVDCGTVKAGSSKTYTGLTDGVYAFRVYTSSTYVSDISRFQVGG